MGKLNKMEIHAIACSIYKNVNDNIGKYNKSEEDKFDDWVEKFSKTSDYEKIETICSYCKDISKKYKDKNIPYHIIMIANYNIKDIIKHIFKSTIKIKKNELNIKDIENDIIVAQAKNENLDKLIEDLTKKYFTL